MASYRSFTNRDCEFYPCHKTDRLNCLFCFCPLYFLDCGGNCTRTSRGLKDCSECLLPHTEHGYDYIIQKLTEVAAKCGPEPDGGTDAEPASPDGGANGGTDGGTDEEPASQDSGTDAEPEAGQDAEPGGSAE